MFFTFFAFFTFIKFVTFGHFWRGKMYCQVVTENLETTLIRKPSNLGLIWLLFCAHPAFFMQINESCWGSQQPFLQQQQQQQQRKLSLAHVKHDCTALEQRCCSHGQSQGLLCCCVSPQVCWGPPGSCHLFLLNPFF